MIVLGTYDAIIYLLCILGGILTVEQILIILYLFKKKGNKNE